MSLVLNILWFVPGGFLVAFAYVFGGLLLCITIIGQCCFLMYLIYTFQLHKKL